MNKEKIVNFKIAKVETLQFAILQENVNESALDIAAGFGFGIDGDAKVIYTGFEYSMLSENNTVFKIEAAVTFEIETECFDKIIDHKTKWIIPKEFAVHMAMSVVGVTRGILHEKTRNTALNKFPLPTIDVQSDINNDIVIEKN